MSKARKQAILILLGVVVLVLAIIVLVRNRDLDTDLLAYTAIAGGLAIVVVSLPINGKNGS